MSSERLPDHYSTLGVLPSATVEQIKAAYRRKALRHHPDKNLGSPQAEEAFKRCTEAFSVLSKERERAIYDARRLAASSVPTLVGDFLHDLLGRRGRQRRNGRDIDYILSLTLEQSARNTERRIEFSSTDPCEACDATGAAPGGLRSCKACGGRGDLRGGGLFSLPKVCTRCGGQGVSIHEACSECGGVGTVEVDREYRVNLPAGVRDGSLTVIKGQGEHGRFGGKPGDLRVTVKIAQHPLFSVKDLDVWIDLPVSFSQAALGDKVIVPTLGGAVQMKVPAGTQSGKLLRLRGKGLPGGGQRGDQIVCVCVETPVALDERQRQALRAFDATCRPEMTPRRQRFQKEIDEGDG